MHAPKRLFGQNEFPLNLKNRISRKGRTAFLRMASPRISPVVTADKRRPTAVWLSIKEKLVSDLHAGLKCNICNALSVKSKKVVYCKCCKTGWCGTCLVLPESKICHLCTTFMSKAQTVWAEGVVPLECLGKSYSTGFLRIVGDYAVVYPTKPEHTAPVGLFDLCTAVSLLTTKYVYVTMASVEKEQSAGEACKEPNSMFTFTLLEGQKKVPYFFIAETAKEAQMWVFAMIRVIESYHAQFKKGAVKKQENSDDDQQVMFGSLRVLTGFPKNWKPMHFALHKDGRFAYYKEDVFTPLKCANMFTLRGSTFHQGTQGGGFEGQLLLLSEETPSKSLCFKPHVEDAHIWTRGIPAAIDHIEQAERQRKDQLNEEKLSSDQLMALAPKDDVPVSRDSLSALSPTARPTAPSIAPTFGAGKWDMVRQKLVLSAQVRKQAEENPNKEGEDEATFAGVSPKGSSTKADNSIAFSNTFSQREELEAKLLGLQRSNISLEAELADLKLEASVAQSLQKELADLRSLVVALSTKSLLPQVFPLPAAPSSAPLSIESAIVPSTPSLPSTCSALATTFSLASLSPALPCNSVPLSSSSATSSPSFDVSFSTGLEDDRMVSPNSPPTTLHILSPSSLTFPSVVTVPNSDLFLSSPTSTAFFLPSPTVLDPSMFPSVPPPTPTASSSESSSRSSNSIPSTPSIEPPSFPSVIVAGLSLSTNVPSSPYPLPPSPAPSPSVTPGPPPPTPMASLDDEEARLLKEIEKMERIAVLRKRLADLQAEVS